jgi:hypothetical protein
VLAGLVATCGSAVALAGTRVDSQAEYRAQARAQGNDHTAAVAIGRALFGTTWPVQVTHVRVDAVGAHRVAGLVLEGTKFHDRLDEAGFLREVDDLIGIAMANAPLDEVDLWVTVPLNAGQGAIVSGDLAEATSRIVFSVTVPRDELRGLAARLHSGDVFWDAAWRASLHGQGK